MNTALTIVGNSRRIGYRLDGMNWLRKTTHTSTSGSIQKAVDAAPPYQYSPGEPRMPVRARSAVMAKPKPKPTPR